jgi:hypothetical protein
MEARAEIVFGLTASAPVAMTAGMEAATATVAVSCVIEATGTPIAEDAETV